MHPISVLVTTFNESEYIEECLRSVEWADEIFLIDSFSTDGTVDLVKEKFPDVRIETRKYYGAAAQKNYGIDHATHDWILVIDADERVTLELKEEIAGLLNGEPEFWGYNINRENLVLGKRVGWGNFKRDQVIRFFHKYHARYPNLRVHADMTVDGPVGKLKGKLTHHYVRSFHHMAARMDRYAYWSASQKFVDGKRCGLRRVALDPICRFLRDYLLRGGFLDGNIGLYLAVMESYYAFLKYLYLWELGRLEKMNKTINLPEFQTEQKLWDYPWENKQPSLEPADHLNSSARGSLVEGELPNSSISYGK